MEHNVPGGKAPLAPSVCSISNGEETQTEQTKSKLVPHSLRHPLPFVEQPALPLSLHGAGCLAEYCFCP